MGDVRREWDVASAMMICNNKYFLSSVRVRRDNFYTAGILLHRM